MPSPISEFERSEIQRVESLALQIKQALTGPVRYLQAHKQDTLQANFALLRAAQANLHHNHPLLSAAVGDFVHESECVLHDMDPAERLEDSECVLPDMGPAERRGVLDEQRSELQAQYSSLVNLLAPFLNHNSSQPLGPPASDSALGRPKPGPPANKKDHEKFAEIVAPYGVAWKQPENLWKICQQADKERVSVPKRWAPVRTWKGGFQKHPDKVVKIIEYKLKKIDRLPSSNL